MATTKQASRERMADGALLEELLKRREPAGVQDLSRALGYSAARVRGELRHLMEMGCELSEHPQRGVALVTAGLGVWEDYLRWRLAVRERGRIIQVYRQTASTQDVARRMVSRSGAAADGALVAADHQTCGRGRLGRKWYAPAGSCVLFSRICMGADDGASDGSVPSPTARAQLSPDRLALGTSVALARAMERAAGPHPLSVQIKWPNDLMVEGRKLAGILVEVVESRPKGGKGQGQRSGGVSGASRGEARGEGRVAKPEVRAAIIGVGINVGLDPDRVPAGAVDDPSAVTSLAAEGCAVERLKVLAEAVAAVDHALAEDDMEALLAEWRRRSVLLGRVISARSGSRTYRGEVIDVDPLEGLVLRLRSGELAHLSAQTTSIL